METEKKWPWKYRILFLVGGTIFLWTLIISGISLIF